MEAWSAHAILKIGHASRGGKFTGGEKEVRWIFTFDMEVVLLESCRNSAVIHYHPLNLLHYNYSHTVEVPLLVPVSSWVFAFENAIRYAISFEHVCPLSSSSFRLREVQLQPSLQILPHQLKHLGRQVRRPKRDTQLLGRVPASAVHVAGAEHDELLIDDGQLEV